jgi:hypothetical protein
MPEDVYSLEAPHDDWAYVASQIAGWLAGIVSALRRLDMAPSDARPSLGAFCALRAWRIVTRDV